MFSNKKYAFKKIDTSIKKFDDKSYEVDNFKVKEFNDTGNKYLYMDDIKNIYNYLKEEGYKPDDIEIFVHDLCLGDFIIKKYNNDSLAPMSHHLYSQIIVSFRKRICYDFLTW